MALVLAYPNFSSSFTSYIKCPSLQMEEHFFEFSIIIEGATEMVQKVPHPVSLNQVRQVPILQCDISLSLQQTI